MGKAFWPECREIFEGFSQNTDVRAVVVGSKEMLDYARDHSTQDGLNYIATWNAAMIVTIDLEEGFRAQAEKRRPEYDDLFGSL